MHMKEYRIDRLVIQITQPETQVPNLLFPETVPDQSFAPGAEALSHPQQVSALSFRWRCVSTYMRPITEYVENISEGLPMLIWKA